MRSSRASSLYPVRPMSYIDLLSTAPLTFSSTSPARSSLESSASLPFLGLPKSPHSNLIDEDAEPINRYAKAWRERRVRRGSPLPWPCDQLEMERQLAEHYLLRLLLGYPFLGPVERILRRAGTSARVLDVCTGTGVWAGDVGEMYPWAEIVGCDTAPLMDLYTCTNVNWDIVELDDLPYDSGSFDVIHLRFVKLRTRAYSQLLRTAYRMLRPGGVILIFETSLPAVKSDETTTKGCQAFTDAYHRSLSYAGLREFSIEDIVKVFKGDGVAGSEMRVPIGHGSGRLEHMGKIHLINTKAFLEAPRYLMTTRGGYTDAEIDVLTAAFLQDVQEYKLYTKYHAFTVRKPRRSES